MAIVQMSKFKLIIFSNNRNALLHELQNFKYVHFHNLNEDNIQKEIGFSHIDVDDKLTFINEEIQKVSFAIETLSSYETKKTKLEEIKTGIASYELTEVEKAVNSFQFDHFYRKFRELISEKEYLENSIEKILMRINELSPWLSITEPVSQLHSFQHCTVEIGNIPKKLKKNIEQQMEQLKLTVYSFICEDKDKLNVLIVAHRNEVDQVQEILRNNSFSRSNLNIQDTPEKEISRLQTEMKQMREKLQTIKTKLQELAIHMRELQLLYDYLMMVKLRISTNQNFLATDYFNIIEGYVPTKLTNEFTQTLQNNLGEDYYLDLNVADDEDPNVPILLENSKFAQSFESLTEMYALPKYKEIDPTPLFSIFYLLFFGMMVADIGYGALMLIGTYFALKLLKLTNKQRRFIRFFYYLSYSTIFWGIMYGSFFGDVIAMPAVIHATEQYNLLLILAIALGVVHIFFALAIQGYMHIKNGRFIDALFDVGFWYLTLGGGIAYLLSLFVNIPAVIKMIGLVIMVIGMIGIVATGGRESKGLGGKIGGGLYSLYGISSYIGDFVSYSRLMALGLSSAFIASAINMMVGMLFDLGFIGILFGIVVFIVGQAFNIFLSILGSYVHTIRLTYVEFFGKFYEGGGKAFKAFQSEPKYIQLK
ncbi:V-type ATP synthase subunit I [Bacillus kwashiorkori]|uniref:V-type ATP synthase subunit I n=1 Tax=Bacillus kwashiorkori TaxID=1522318 RepID=UPI00078342BA|nr:V-type ATP synthase subunit I [Bacillus kwashiorkori]